MSLLFCPFFVSHFFRLCIVSFIKNNGKPNELSRDQLS